LYTKDKSAREPRNPLREGEIIMAATRETWSAEREAEAQALAQRLRELVDEELLQVARLLVGKGERDIFGDTEFQLRDILLKAGAKALEEHLRQKKTATRDAV
jgi:parvulin-like peptidyl-prolyl isomerase